MNDSTFGEVLRDFREKAGLSLKELGLRMGKNGRTVSYYELKPGPPKPPLALEFANALDLAGEDRNKLLTKAGYKREPIRDSPAPKERLPYLQPPFQIPHEAENFVSRNDFILSEFKDEIVKRGPGSILALFGPGGIGKSTLVAQAIRELNNETMSPRSSQTRLHQKFPDGVVWYDFKKGRDANLTMEYILDSFSETPASPPSLTVRRLLSNKHALLILESVEAAYDLKDILDVRGKCTVIITARDSLSAPASALNWERTIKPLPQTAAIELLKKSAGLSNINQTVADVICNELGYLPLALHLAGRYMRATSRNDRAFAQMNEQKPN